MQINKYVLGDFAVNCYLCTTDTTALFIDLPLFNEEIKKAVDKNQGKDFYVLLTHAHIDHIFGINEFVRYSGAKLYMYYEEAKMLNDSEYNLSNYFSIPCDDISVFGTFDGEGKYTLGDISFEVISTPGHTSGSVCYLIGDNLFSGDTLFFMTVGRTDFPSGNSEILKNSVNKLLKLDKNYQVLPGHERETDIFSERKYNPFSEYEFM